MNSQPGIGNHYDGAYMNQNFALITEEKTEDYQLPIQHYEFNSVYHSNHQMYQYNAEANRPGQHNSLSFQKSRSTGTCLQDKLAALAATSSVLDEALSESDAASKAKVVKQMLDPALFRPAKRSRFDEPPHDSMAATGANATPLGKEPSIVLNKHVISSTLGTGSKKALMQKRRIGLLRNKDGSLCLPEVNLSIDTKIQRAIMQQLVQMVEFKFTIGINKLYKSITRNQKNKKKCDPLKIEDDITIENLITYCEGMTHLVRVKKKRFIKLHPHITPYMKVGVNLWAMFHGRNTRQIIRENWTQWIGPAVTPQKFGMDWDFYFLCLRSMYMSLSRKQRGKYRSKHKGILKYVISSTIWATKKSVRIEKLVQELACNFAVKKQAQSLVKWHKVIHYAVSAVNYLGIERGDLITFHPKLKNLLMAIEVFTKQHSDETLTMEMLPEFETTLRKYCLEQCGYDWSVWDMSLRTLIKLHNSANTIIHRPDPNDKSDVRVPFAKTLRAGFEEVVLPIQENKLGEPTIQALVKRDMARMKRMEERETKKTVDKVEKVEKETELEEETEMEPVCGGEEDSPLYTYCQYVQPIVSDTLYPIPGGSHIEDEIKLRVQNQPCVPGQGYGIALSGRKQSILFVFYPHASTVRCSHYNGTRHHHKFYGDFKAAKLNLFQLTIKIKRNRFEIFTDGLCIKTVPAFMNTVGITCALVTAEGPLPFVNFRVRRVSPGVPVLPYLVRRRHQRGVQVTVTRHPEHGLVTKISKVSGNIELFVTHLKDLLTTECSTPHVLLNNITRPDQTVKTVVWVVGHHATKIKSWLKCIGF